MKVKVKRSEKVFKPIKVVITLETFEELAELWSRLESDYVSRLDLVGSQTRVYPLDGTAKLFNSLDDLLYEIDRHEEALGMFAE